MLELFEYQFLCAIIQVVRIEYLNYVHQLHSKGFLQNNKKKIKLTFQMQKKKTFESLVFTDQVYQIVLYFLVKNVYMGPQCLRG